MQTDILNPTTVYEEDIEDSMTPNYGFTRKRTGTQLHKKAVGSTPWTRETQNTGHVFVFSWLGRSQACAERLKWYYEQYEDGFFTIVDWDGGGRQYVGRFTTEVIPVETGNGMYDVQNVTFEEMPTVPMVEYPSNWDDDSVIFFVANDFGDQKLATTGAWTEAAIGATPAVTLGGIARGAANPIALPLVVMTDPGTVNDYAVYEYRGYGFQLWLCQGTAFGKADIYVDEVLLTTVDCYSASLTGPQMVLSEPDMSLDFHRVMVVCDGTKNGASTATTISWWGLQVMR